MSIGNRKGLRSVLDTISKIVNGSPDDSVNKFGFNNDVDTAGPEDIASIGGLYPYSTFSTAQSIEVLSSSANDGIAGTGARQITVEGLDASLAQKTEIITMNGLTAVDLPGTWLAINRAFVNDNQTGSLGTNEGTITFRVDGGGTTVSNIPALRGQTQQCVYRVPAGKTLRIKNITSYTDASAGKTASMQLVRVGVDCLTTRILSSGTLTESSRWTRKYEVGGPKIPAGAWAAIRALEVLQNDTQITADFDAVLE